MRDFIIGVLVFSVLSCAATYKGPTIIAQEKSSRYTVSKEDVLISAKKILVSEGFQITNSDDSAGIISTAPRDLRLTPEQADCGTTMGIDYLKDKRTTTRVSYGVIIDQEKITIKANIEGEYKPGAVDQNITLTCISRGRLENDLMSKILPGNK